MAIAKELIRFKIPTSARQLLRRANGMQFITESLICFEMPPENRGLLINLLATPSFVQEGHIAA
jgi:hypothetical protein